MKQLFYPFSFALCILFFAQCRKHDSTPTVVLLQVQASDSVTGQPVITPVQNYPLPPTRTGVGYVFNWEQGDTMPVDQYSQRYYTPWSDHAIRAYNPELRFDYKKSDGWELVVNTFSPQGTPGAPVFILYNKFRGIIRFYCNVGNADISRVANYNVLLHALKLSTLSGTTSNLLNFADQHIVDVDKPSAEVSMIDPWSIASNGWYMSQFELAYDPTLYQKSATSIALQWFVEFAQMLSATVNNTALTTYKLNLQQEGNAFSDALNANVTGNMQIMLRTPGEFANLKGIFPDAAIGNVQQQANGNAKGNIFNAVLIPKAGITNLKLETTAAYQRQPNLVGFFSLGMAVMGVDNSAIQGAGPVFNEPPGIFYLAKKPVVNYTKTNGQHIYSLNAASVAYIFNPFVYNYASIANIKQELVAEDAAEKNALGTATIYSGQQLKANKPLKVIGVRTSFDVVPKNGSDTVHIVKTFVANVAEQ